MSLLRDNVRNAMKRRRKNLRKSAVAGKRTQGTAPRATAMPRSNDAITRRITTLPGFPFN
jgi:hypothetical protein